MIFVHYEVDGGEKDFRTGFMACNQVLACLAAFWYFIVSCQLGFSPVPACVFERFDLSIFPEGGVIVFIVPAVSGWSEAAVEMVNNTVACCR